jgi:hypothetical protein
MSDGWLYYYNFERKKIRTKPYKFKAKAAKNLYSPLTLSVKGTTYNFEATN